VLEHGRVEQVDEAEEHERGAIDVEVLGRALEQRGRRGGGLRAALRVDDVAFPKDDVIFYNKETDYTLGLTPLVCLLHLKSEDGEKIRQKLLSGEVDAME